MIVIALLFLAEAPPWRDYVATDTPPTEWLSDHTPHGMDVTPDGKVWINIREPGEKDDYALLAADVYKAQSKPTAYPTAWLRGYHLKNSRTTVRETKWHISVDCSRDTITTTYYVGYKASGEILSQRNMFDTTPIIPGSNGEAYRDFLCPKN